MALTPNALRVLDHVGVYDRIVADGASYSGVQMINTNGEPLGRIVLGSKELYGYDAVRIYRSRVHRCLLDQALAEGIDIQFEVRVLNVASDDAENGVTLNLADGKTIKVGLVICADGMHSTLRSHIDPTAAAVYNGQTAVTTFLPTVSLDLTTWTDSVAVFGVDGSFFILSADSHHDKLLCFTTVDLPDRSREEWRALGKDSRALASFFERFNIDSWPQIVRDVVRNAPPDGLAI